MNHAWSLYRPLGMLCVTVISLLALKQHPCLQESAWDCMLSASEYLASRQNIMLIYVSNLFLCSTCYFTQVSYTHDYLTDLHFKTVENVY